MRNRLASCLMLAICSLPTIATAFPPTDVASTQSPVSSTTNPRRIAVRLSWVETDTTVTKFYIKRRAGTTGQFTDVAELDPAFPQTAYAFTDTTIPSGTATTYQYRIHSLRIQHMPWTAHLVVVDADNDSVTDVVDNCVGSSNSNQLDADGDGLGDACDSTELAECSGLPAVAPSTTVEVNCDRAPSDTQAICDVEDIVAAMGDCNAANGCKLQFHNATYEGVDVLIHNNQSYACATDGINDGYGTYTSASHCLNMAFENGLVIQGHGKDTTTLRSPIWTYPYNPAPLLRIMRRPDLGFRMRNLALDGRKSEQPNPHPTQESWVHFGFEYQNDLNFEMAKNANGCIHDTTVKNFLSFGVQLLHTSNWIVEQNTVEEIGCWTGLTEDCPLLPNGPGLPDGYKSNGYGIFAGMSTHGMKIRHNDVTRVVKYAIGMKDEGNGDGLCALPGGGSVDCAVRDAVVEDNQLIDNGTLGIFAGGVANVTIQRNTVDGLSLPTDNAPTSSNTFGLSCSGVGDGKVIDNTFRNLAGMGISWQCWSSSATPTVLDDNVIDESCQEKNPTIGYNEAAIRVANGGSSTPLWLIRSTVSNTECAKGIEAVSGAQVIVDRGLYSAGPNTTHLARFTGANAVIQSCPVFTGSAPSCLSYEASSTGAVTANVGVWSCTPPVSSSGGSTPLDCITNWGACETICQGATPPAWCAYRGFCNQLPPSPPF